ncbi:MAG: hypothetical protein ACK5LV_08160 [Lachnospirales bacterium]
MNIVYKNDNYLKIGATLAILCVVMMVLFKSSDLCYLYPFVAFFSFKFFKKFYQNYIKENDEFFFNGVTLMKKDSIEKVFMENGRNLEKKYKQKHTGVDKYKNSSYIVFEFKSGNHSVVRDYDAEYFRIIQNKYFNKKNN